MFDVISYLDSRGVDYATSGKNIAPGWAGMRCTQCLDSSNHFGVNIATGSFSCFRCGAKGNVIKLITIIDDCSYQQARTLADKFQTGDIQRKEQTRAITQALPKFAKKPLPEIHRKYLENRGFDADLLTAKYDLYGCEHGSNYQYRIIIPVYQRKRLVTFTARAVIETAALRYKNCPVPESVVSIKECLYNLDNVKESAIVVEGVFDAWRVGDGACATLGTQITQEQIRLLSQFKNVFIMLDSEAVNEAEKLSYALASIVNHVEIIHISAKDPCEMSDTDIRALKKDLCIQ